MNDEYQGFYKHWYDKGPGSDFRNEFPYTLSLGAEGVPSLPFRHKSTTGNQIIITKPYDNMLHRILKLRERDKGDSTGVMLIGQPGIGASLTRSLCPCDNSPAHLFSRENHLPKVPARMANFISPGCTPVYQLYGPPFLRRSSVLSIEIRKSPSKPTYRVFSHMDVDRCRLPEAGAPSWSRPKCLADPGVLFKPRSI